MTHAVPYLIVLSVLGAGPAWASCTTVRCGAAQQAEVAAVRAEVAATCDCAGSAKHRDYTRCAKTVVRAAQRAGRVGKACARATVRCAARSTCGRPGAVVCCAATKRGAVGRVARSAARCRDATVCTHAPHAADACLADTRCCLAVVARGPVDVLVPGSPLGVAGGFEVRANGPTGCADLDGPLVALNYFSFADRDRYLRYTEQVVGVLEAHGHRAIGAGRRVETLMAPAGAPANGGSYEHDELALAWYASGGGFLDFLRSEAQQALVFDQQAGARQSDYVWGLQRCIRGCDEAPTFESGLLLAHVFRYEGPGLDASIETLAAAPGAPELFYAGENVAELRLLVGDTSINPQKPPWGRGAVVFRVASRDAAAAWLADPAYVGFRAETAEDVAVVLDGGL